MQGMPLPIKYLSLYKVVKRIKCHFSKNSGMEIFNTLKDNLQPKNVHEIKELCFILPTDYTVDRSEISPWLIELMNFCVMMKENQNLIYPIINAISDAAFTHLGFDWDEFVPIAFELAQACLKLPHTPKKGKKDPKKRLIKSLAKLIVGMLRDGDTSKHMIRFCNTLIQKNGVIEY
jgi:hypothetical protein